MKNKNLNNAFPIVAAALGNKFGVKVSVGGSDAYTTGKMINIPAYNLDDPSYKDVAGKLRAMTKAWRERTPSAPAAEEPASSRPS